MTRFRRLYVLIKNGLYGFLPESPVEVEGVNNPLKGAKEASKEAVIKSS